MNEYIPSWFDLAVVGVLSVGLLRGRKNGMSAELLPLVQALAIVVLGSHLYQPLGQMLFEATPVFSLLFAFVVAYLIVALAIQFLVNKIKHAAGEKLTSSDVFGRGEYYFGMVAGGLRFACFLVIFLALFHAREYTESDRMRQAQVQKENFGSVSFPTLTTIQHEIFTRSTVGQFVKNNLNSLLIEPTRPDPRPLRRPDSISGQREGAVDAVIAHPLKEQSHSTNQ